MQKNPPIHTCLKVVSHRPEQDSDCKLISIHYVQLELVLQQRTTKLLEVRLSLADGQAFRWVCLHHVIDQ